ncbi:MAG: hypothetical protein H6Q57_508 [Geobacteraceae bacterium]|nr:hypothetical protein [Geobacteraceae bacterium]
MPGKYPNNFLKNVTLRLDFGQNHYEISSEVPHALQEKIQERFPFKQRKAALAEQMQIVSETEIKRSHVRENHWFFQAKDGGRTLCIAPNFLWIDYKKYDDFSDFEETFSVVAAGLYEAFPDLTVNRFGLRYLNEIELTDSRVTDWEEYLDGNLLTIFALADDKTRISRAFHNLEMNYGDINLTFLYGMHNPDYPAPLRQKTFVLDFDAYALKNIGKENLAGNMRTMHDKITSLFEKSITEKMREMMR